MKINGLKVMQDKGWKADSTFTADDGRTMQIPANHKAICTDEVGDVVNLTIVAPSPVSLRIGQVLDGLSLAGNVSKNSFGWMVKATVVTPAKA